MSIEVLDTLSFVSVEIGSCDILVPCIRATAASIDSLFLSASIKSLRGICAQLIDIVEIFASGK